MKRVVLCIPIILLFLLTSCFQPENQDGLPEWLTSYIAECEADTTNSIDYNTDQIWQYDYKGETVFYFMSGCCDFYNWVYDYDGNVLGAPDGGWSGSGDGRLTDWSTEKSNAVLVWTKPRD